MNDNIIFVDYNNVDMTKISFSKQRDEYNRHIINVNYEDKPAIFKIPNYKLSPLGIEIFPSEKQFLILLDYIQKHMPRSKRVVKVNNIYIKHPYDINRPVRIKVDNVINNGIKITGYDNRFCLAFNIIGF